MKLAVFLATGFEEVEAITVIDYLRRAGVEVSVVSVEASTPVTGAHNMRITPDIGLNDYLVENANSLPDAIYLPGGMPGATNLADNQQLIDFIKTCFDANKIISAICAAPVVVLAKTGVLQNRKFACYPGMQGDLAGYMPNTPVVVDSNLVTGAGPGCAGKLAVELVRLLCNDQSAQDIHESTLL